MMFDGCKEFYILRNVRNTIQDLERNNFKMWNDKYISIYMKLLEKEYFTIKCSIEDLIYLLNQKTNKKYRPEQVEDISLLIRKRKYKWTEFLPGDFDYIIQLEYLIQSGIPQIKDEKKAEKQLEMLNLALRDIVATYNVVKHYRIDCAQY